MTTAILIPAMRGDRLRALIANIEETTPGPCEVHIAATIGVHAWALDDDPRVTRWFDDGGTWGGRLNELFRHTTEPYLFLGADDVRFHPGWLEAALSVMADTDGVVAVNDLWNPRGTLALVSRRYLVEEGGTVDGTGAIIHEGYGHVFSETELFETAASRGRFAYCAESVVEHLHPVAGKAEDDEVYRLGFASLDADTALYQSRRHLWSA
jgi:hypothetical protein